MPSHLYKNKMVRNMTTKLEKYHYRKSSTMKAHTFKYPEEALFAKE